MSSSKRGRKRNDNLPPNRARDVQRAFRARRAAHLQALEQRVAELEEENGHLRQALHLPPANRPPLGRGPTGKDKPPEAEVTTSAGSPFSSGRESSALAESPPSRRSSKSPIDSIPVSMSPSRPMTVLDGSWNDEMLIHDHAQATHPSPMLLNDHPYPVSPMANPVPMKPMQFSSPYANAVASSSRQVSDGYGAQRAQGYVHASGRSSTANYAHPAFSFRGENMERPPYMHFGSPPPNPFHHSQAPQSVQPTARLLHHPQPTPGHVTFLQERDRPRDSPAHYPTHRASLPNIHAHHNYPLEPGYPGSHVPASHHPPLVNSPSRSQFTDYAPPDTSDTTLSTASTTRPSYAPDGRIHPSMS